jgi:predicted Fe-Mo cluster-binding NifX family protein
MRVCVPVTPDGQVGPRWGRAERLAVAEVAAGQITDWREFAVDWYTLHEQGTEGAHHARVARFLRDQHVETVLAGHMGAPMQTMLHKLGLRVLPAGAGDARTAVLAAGS